MTDSPTPEPTQRDAGRPGDSILDMLARRTGRAPRVSLRDAGTGDSTPLIDPKAHSFQDELSQEDQGKYRILGEIARGGMGVILRSHDLELGREVAMKVVDTELSRRPEVVERFVEEAQIGGQLQHPGIVPVYELGLMADQRPYFTMKLIKGRTLAAMLSRRESVGENRVHFLNIFESVCQTMAYAHSKGVIHRDLKPANIMVGAFNEVQVVDWGLSKVLRRGGVADEIEARDTALTVIETVRSGPGSDTDSIVGNVVGTPAYMSPEQAQGEIDKLDERTDVFALGAILCEILTGAPPFVRREADPAESLVQKAALAELDDARDRIATCGAAPELKKLCNACLMPSRAARPRDAEKVAAVVHEHLSGLEQLAYEERLNAERSRRRTQLVLLVGALLFVALGAGGGGWWWVDAQRRARQAELARAFDEVGAEVLSHERAGDLERALESAQGGLRLVESGDADRELLERARKLLQTTRQRADEEQERLAALQQEQLLFARLEDLLVRQMISSSQEDVQALDREYGQAFLDFGIDVRARELGDVLAAYRDTPVGIRIAQGFDSWSRLLRYIEDQQPAWKGVPADLDFAHTVELVTGIGLDLDPDPTRADVRMALVEVRAEPLLELARDEAIEELGPETLFALGTALDELGEEQAATWVLTTGAHRHPSSFPLLSSAGSVLSDQSMFVRAESYLRAAAALRPELSGIHSRLADVLMESGDAVGSLAAIDAAIRLAPGESWNDLAIGIEYVIAGQFDAALRHLDANLESRTTPSFDDEELPRFVRVLAGRADRETYLAWVDAHGAQGLSKWSRPMLLLTLVVPAGLEPQPERALEILGPYRPIEHVDYWISMGAAHALTGDGPVAISCAQRLEALAWQNRFYRTLAFLLRAAGHAVSGAAEEADTWLGHARTLRDELYGGRPEDWTGGVIEIAFDRLEPIALGR